jgi:hypothetical protein
MTSGADRAPESGSERALFVWLRACGLPQGDIVTFRGETATEDHIHGGRDTDGTRLREPSESVRLRDGTAAERPLLQLTAGEIVAAAPPRAASCPSWPAFCLQSLCSRDLMSLLILVT